LPKEVLARKEKTMTKERTALKTGAQLASVAAAAAGIYYFLAGPKAKQHRLQAKTWAKKAQKEVAEEIQKLKKVSRPIYERTVNQVAEKYKQLKNVDPVELREFTSQLKSYWDNFSQNQSAAKPARASTRKTRKPQTGKTK
jgi:hypothetical protein